MGTEATGLTGKMPPALLQVRARSRATRVADLHDDGAASTPTLRTSIRVPFLWEVAPGKPKPQGARPAAALSHVHEDGGAAGTDGGDHDDGDAKARPVPLKLPPRLQVTPTAAGHSSLSPKTVLQGPYGSAKRPPRRSGSVSGFRRTPSTGTGFFSWRNKAAAATCTNTKKNKGGRDHDAPCCSPSASSASSSSSSSVSFFCDDHGHGPHRRPADVRADSEEEGAANGSVRITRFRRNRSLPSMTTSHLWASIRKGVKQIAQWS